MSVIVGVTGWDAAPWARALAAVLRDRPILVTDRDGRFSGDPAALDSVRHALVWKPRPELLARLPKLEVIFSLGAGVDHLMSLDGLPDVPIVRVVDPDLTGRMTEYVVWQVLDHHRQGPAYRAQQAKHEWRELRQPAASAVAVGILGLGVLGRDAAAALSRIGFQVRGWSRTPKSVPDVECFAGPNGLDAFLAGTDILVSLLPLTPDTRGFVSHALLKKLRRNGPLGGAVFVNAGRGGTQAEADILCALEDGTLKGATLDVFADEPLPADSPSWAAPNLQITPHVAAASDPAALSRRIARQIANHEAGRGLSDLVDRTAGY